MLLNAYELQNKNATGKKSTQFQLKTYNRNETEKFYPEVHGPNEGTVIAGSDLEAHYKNNCALCSTRQN